MEARPSPPNNGRTRHRSPSAQTPRGIRTHFYLFIYLQALCSKQAGTHRWRRGRIAKEGNKENPEVHGEGNTGSRESFLHTSQA